MNERLHSRAGFALIEVLVALLLFALIATPAARTLAVAQRSRVSSGRWMQASEIAGALLERLRAGAEPPQSEEIDGFTRSWYRREAYPGVDRCDITVAWSDRGARDLVLTTLLASRP